MSRKPLYIFDIDGTVADLTHRLPAITCDSPQWDDFYEACDKDDPISNVITTARKLLESGCELWFFTGRMNSGDVKKKTLTWLNKHVTHGFYNIRGLENRVVMRPPADYRADNIIKLEMLENMLEIDRNRLVATFDDRQRVVDMWRENNVQCFQVAEGDF